MPTEHDVVVIGSGPAGYVAAIRAAQLGFNVACIELSSTLGGTCLNVGCIPSKVLLETTERYHDAVHNFSSIGIVVDKVGFDLSAILKRKTDVVGQLTRGIDGLLKKNKITRYLGRGRILAPGKVVVEASSGGNDPAPVELTAKHILIATGSKSAPLPGVVVDGVVVGTSTEALNYEQVPKHLVVIGAGVIGLELGSVWARLGAKVTVLEYLDRILPGIDAEIAKEAQRSFQKQGIEFKLASKVIAAKKVGDGAVVEIEGQPAIECDRVLLAVGRSPNTEGLGLEAVGIELGKRGVIPVNEHFETKVPGIYAFGDVIPGPMLAHKAEEEGIACVEYIKTGYGHVNYDAIPGVVYTHPEVASVGKTEEELKAAGIPYRKGVYPFSPNGRAKALNVAEGRVKVLADVDTDRILGVHIFGPRAGDIIAEAVAAIEFGASAEDVARTCHAHPTLAEAFKEAALGVHGRTIHL